MKTTAWLTAHLRKAGPKSTAPVYGTADKPHLTPRPDPTRRHSAFIAP